MKYKSNNKTIIPFLLHLHISEMPKNLVLNRYDNTYLKTHKGFKSFRLDKLEIEFDNGKNVKIITNQHPLIDRTFEINTNWYDSIEYYEVITEDSDFKIIMSGVSYSRDGKVYPFEYVQEFHTLERTPIGTYFRTWAGA